MVTEPRRSTPSDKAFLAALWDGHHVNQDGDLVETEPHIVTAEEVAEARKAYRSACPNTPDLAGLRREFWDLKEAFDAQ